MKNKSYITLLVFTLMFLVQCSLNEQSIELTTEFVKSPSLSKDWVGISIARLKLKKKYAGRSLESIKRNVIKECLTIDSAFYFLASYDSSKLEGDLEKIYFNRYNGFYWYLHPSMDPGFKSEFRSIGELKKNSWYVLGGIGKPRVSFYFFINKEGKVTTYSFLPKNW